MSAPVRRTTADAGFTLLETMVTISIAGIVMAFAVSGWTAYAKVSAQEGAVQLVQSVLRQAQQQAVTEGTSICAEFDVPQDRFTLYRGACDDAAKVKLNGSYRLEARAHLSSAAFTSATGATGSGVTFTSRGTAWPGSISITRDDSSVVRVVKVEGLTGRVSSD
jgi:prepilin-type N-terminal cleavage/methylation domain-containing protein